MSNQVINWLDIRFPEFSNMFMDWTGKTAQATLRAFPTPARIVAARPEAILKAWRTDIQRASLKKAEKLVGAAAASVGRTAGSEVAEVALQNLLMQYAMIKEQRQNVERLMQELLLRVPNAAKLMEIKGIGMLTAAVIVSEIGNVQRFREPAPDLEDGRPEPAGEQFRQA